MGLDRDAGNELRAVCDAKGGSSGDLFEKTVVVSVALPESAPVKVESEAGNKHEIQISGGDRGVNLRVGLGNAEGATYQCGRVGNEMKAHLFFVKNKGVVELTVGKEGWQQREIGLVREGGISGNSVGIGEVLVKVTGEFLNEKG